MSAQPVIPREGYSKKINFFMTKVFDSARKGNFPNKRPHDTFIAGKMLMLSWLQISIRYLIVKPDIILNKVCDIGCTIKEI